MPGIQDAMQYSMAEKTTGQGAATTFFAALSPETADGGKYVVASHLVWLINLFIIRFCDDSNIATPKTYASDPEVLYTFSRCIVAHFIHLERETSLGFGSEIGRLVSV